MVLLIFISVTVLFFGQHDAHEHGSAEMQIILENDYLELLLLIPGADFVGFEHSNASDAENKMIHKRMEELESEGEGLILFKTAWWMKVMSESQNAGEVEEGKTFFPVNG